MKKFFTGTLRHKVILERRARVADGAGGYETAWETVTTLWASIERVRGSESYSAGKLSAKATHLFRLRYYSGIDTDMRLTFQNRTYNIRSIHNIDMRDRVLEVFAEEGV